MTISPTTLVVATLAALAVLFIVAYALSGAPDPTEEVARRLSRYGGGLDVVDDTGTTVGNTTSLRDLLGGASAALNPLLSRGNRGSRLAEDLQKADLKLKPSEWILAVFGVFLALGLVLSLRFGGLLPLPISGVAGWFLSGVYLRLRQRRRTRAFERQLGDTIILLSNALKAGYSFAQALSTVSKSASPPISEEFARATREIALGIGIDDALAHMVERNRSEDFDLLVTAVQIQRVAGGNLAEILDTIAFTIRERVRIQGEIRTLTAQARVSGWIITLLPVALAGILSVISPTYFGPMLSETLGRIMLGIGLFSMGIGFAIIQKIVKIEV